MGSSVFRSAFGDIILYILHSIIYYFYYCYYYDTTRDCSMHRAAAGPLAPNISTSGYLFRDDHNIVQQYRSHSAAA